MKYTMKKPITKKLENEIKKIMKELVIGGCPENLSLQNHSVWNSISKYQTLSEKFMRTFQDKLWWCDISVYQKLSEPFMKEMQEMKDKFNWHYLCQYQKLSENFMVEMKDRIAWDQASTHQKMSEKFIRKMEDYVDWNEVSFYQKLSEKFIREFVRNLDFESIYNSQKLSEKFIEEFKGEIDIPVYKASHRKTTREEKAKEMKEYAEIHTLKFDGKYLYAFRNHDIHGRGAFMGSTFYEKGKYYKDWHLDMRKDVKNSFGLGIWPEGNTPVKVKVRDWGVCVDRGDGKCRVWGFEVL